MSTPRTRHVWCRPLASAHEHPGLVLEWRRDAGGTWAARVQYVVEHEGGWKAASDWFTVDRLTPVESQPNIGSAYG